MDGCIGAEWCVKAKAGGRRALDPASTQHVVPHFRYRNIPYPDSVHQQPTNRRILGSHEVGHYRFVPHLGSATGGRAKVLAHFIGTGAEGNNRCKAVSSPPLAVWATVLPVTTFRVEFLALALHGGQDGWDSDGLGVWL